MTSWIVIDKDKQNIHLSMYGKIYKNWFDVAIDLGLVSVKQFIGNNGHKVTKRWFGKLGNRESDTTSYVCAQRL